MIAIPIVALIWFVGTIILFWATGDSGVWLWPYVVARYVYHRTRMQYFVWKYRRILEKARVLVKLYPDDVPPDLRSIIASSEEIVSRLESHLHP